MIKINLVNTQVKIETDVHEVASCVRGFHIYGDNWTSSMGAILICEREWKSFKADSNALATALSATVFQLLFLIAMNFLQRAFPAV